MEYVYFGLAAVCISIFFFIAFELEDVLKEFAKAKIKVSENMLAIEREKTRQEELKTERARKGLDSSRS